MSGWFDHVTIHNLGVVSINTVEGELGVACLVNYFSEVHFQTLVAVHPALVVLKSAPQILGARAFRRLAHYDLRPGTDLALV